jgi:hypothetical protein
LRKRRWLVVLFSVAFVLFLLYFLRWPLLTPIARFAVRELFRTEIGMEASLGSLGGTLLSSLEIHRLRAHDPAPESPLRALDVEFARVEYSPWNLLFHRERALRSLRADISRIEVDLECVVRSAVCRAYADTRLELAR